MKYINDNQRIPDQADLDNAENVTKTVSTEKKSGSSDGPKSLGQQPQDDGVKAPNSIQMQKMKINQMLYDDPEEKHQIEQQIIPKAPQGAQIKKTYKNRHFILTNSSK